MKKLILTAAGLCAGVALMSAAAPAMAHVDVGIHIGIPGVFVQPAPVYVEPQPVYVQPVYAQPVYVQPVYERRVYVRPDYVIEHRYHDGWERRHWRGNEFRRPERRDRHDGHYGR